MNARLLATVVCIAASARAAEITRVASSFEPNDPFGMYVDLTYLFTMHDALILREAYGQTNNTAADVRELRYKMHEHRLNADVHLGIFRDLEFHFGLGYTFSQDRQWGFAKGTNSTNSTIVDNCLRADGERLPDVSTGPGRCGSPLFKFSEQDGRKSYRSGLADLTFGLAWAVLNQKKDDAAPTWVLGFDYSAPVAEAINPSVETLSDARGSVGDKLHRYKFYTSISKRVAFADPYFSLHYTLPWQSSGFYTNCDNPSSERMARPQNCGLPGWSRSQTGIQPAHVGGFIFGSEFNMFEAANKHQKLALDLRGSVTYVSEGRYYNEMSDLMGKLLYAGDYVALGARAGFVGHAAEFIHLKAFVEMAYNTEHMLTAENIGKDLTEPKNGTVDITDHPEEVSPLFDYRVDRVGRRFRIVEMFVTRVMVQATFSF